MRADILEQFVQHYPDQEEAKCLVEGFKKGFTLHYEGPERSRRCENLPSALNKPTVFQDKFLKEIKAGRFIGPFVQEPMLNLQCSPMGLVPKKGNKNKFRMITHLSYPNGDSINSHIPKCYTTVQYKSFDYAIEMIVKQGHGAYMAKTDIQSAFRLIPMSKESLRLLGMTFQGFLYLDACLPFGAAESCAIFEKLSTFLDWYFQRQSQQDASHYLDDFFFCHCIRAICKDLLETFQEICGNLGIPIAPEKTEGPATYMEFLGIGIDTLRWLLIVPKDKILDILNKIDYILSKKTVTVETIQSLCGQLNFITRVIKPGRPFIRRLYLAISKFHHKKLHVGVNSDIKQDLRIWKKFLSEFKYNRPLPDLKVYTNTDLTLYTDASSTLGFGAYMAGEWTVGKWSEQFKSSQPSMAILELYPILVALVLWSSELANKNVLFMCDNQAVVQIINQQTSSCPVCLAMIKYIVLHNMQHNINITCDYIESESNNIADSISRFQWRRFRQEAPQSRDNPLPLPSFLWPISRKQLLALVDNLMPTVP